LRIALITDKFNIGGGLEHIYQIVNSMQDFNFFIFAKGGDAQDKFKHLNNVFLTSSGYNREFVLKFNPDVIHIHHLKPLFHFYRMNYLSFYHVPVVFTAHGMHIYKYEFYKQDVMTKIKFWLRFNLEKYLFNRVNKIITVSEEDKNFIVKNYHIDIAKIDYVSNGINFAPIENIISSKEDLRIKLNLPLDKFIFLTVARFDFQKGYDILLNSIKMLKSRINTKNILFVMVGDGETLDESKSFVNKNNLKDLVLFEGKCNNVYEFMKASDCFILPSRWEVLPITIIEAGALKLFVIASDTYGNRSIVKHLNNGILFKNLSSEDLLQKIIWVLDNKNNLSTYSLNLYENVTQDYNVNQMIEKLRSLYRGLK
jgi:glycosyltransferase involved in cell wall biosynthesis